MKKIHRFKKIIYENIDESVRKFWLIFLAFIDSTTNIRSIKKK